VAGTVSGTGLIDLGAGNDVLTLNDGAVVTATIGGGGQTSADSVVLNNAGALSLAPGELSGFEQLTKQNTGIVTLTGLQTYSAGTSINAGTLSVGGTLETPTVTLADGSALEALGIVQATGPTPTTITGSGGTNTLRVGSGATLLATGDLGAGSDLLD